MWTKEAKKSPPHKIFNFNFMSTLSPITDDLSHKKHQLIFNHLLCHSELNARSHLEIGFDI
jgi:hypothetical protein